MTSPRVQMSRVIEQFEAQFLSRNVGKQVPNYGRRVFLHGRLRYESESLNCRNSQTLVSSAVTQSYYLGVYFLFVNVKFRSVTFYGTLNLFPVPLNCSYHGNDPLHSHNLCLPAILMDKGRFTHSMPFLGRAPAVPLPCLAPKGLARHGTARHGMAGERHAMCESALG